MAERIKLPEGCGQFARHTSWEATPDEPGELWSCPEAGQHLGRGCSGRRDLARLRLNLAARWPTLAKFGQGLLLEVGEGGRLRIADPHAFAGTIGHAHKPAVPLKQAQDGMHDMVCRGT